MGKKISALITSLLFALGITSCTGKPDTPDITDIDIKPDMTVAGGIRNYAFNLYHSTISDNNTVISPVSVLYALSMTGNGADGDTLVEMQKALGGREFSELNQYLYEYDKMITNTENREFSIANAIWVNNNGDFKFSETYDQVINDYYKANIKTDKFSEKTLDDINGFVKKNTNKMIEKILDRINEDAVMYLVNAVAFEGKWYQEYKESNIEQQSAFTNYDKSESEVDYLCDHCQNSVYFKDSNALGFMKGYKGDNFSFVAILPDEGVDIKEYAKSLTGDRFKYLIDNPEYADYLNTKIPEFTVEWGGSIKGNLKELGIYTAFEADADFSKMGESQFGLQISDVIHRAKIEVDRKGTKAAAATIVEMMETSAFPDEEYKEPVIIDIFLERPFIYIIMDNETQTPIFMGTVMKLK